MKKSTSRGVLWFHWDKHILSLSYDEHEVMNKYLLLNIMFKLFGSILWHMNVCVIVCYQQEHSQLMKYIFVWIFSSISHENACHGYTCIQIVIIKGICLNIDKL